MKPVKEFSIKKLTVAAVLLGLTLVLTAFLTINVPNLNGAYIHFGDAVIFLAVYALGMKYSPFISGLGGMFADLIVAPQYAPFTLVIKALMAIVAALIMGSSRSESKPGRARTLWAMLAGGLVMIICYYFVDGFMYGNFLAALTSGVLFNVIQAVSSVAIAWLSIPFLKGVIRRTLWS